MAEREGFEPSLGLTLNTLSRRAPSATQPPLQTCQNLYVGIKLYLMFILRRTRRARYSRLPVFRPSGHAPHVLNCSRQFSQPLKSTSPKLYFALRFNLGVNTSMIIVSVTE